jgi:hypothetical protein
LLLDEQTQAAAHELVVVSEKDANFSHDGFMAGLVVNPRGEGAVLL